MFIQSTLMSKKDVDYLNLVNNVSHFYDTFGGKDRDKKKIPEMYNLEKVIEHYLRAKKKKKIYLKKGNLYIVGKYFTEGIQFVPEGEEHHFRILGIRPIDIVILKNSKDLPINSLDKSFIKVDECLRAKPGNKYSVGDCYYLILTPYKASFKKTILKSNEVPSPSSDGDHLKRENDTAREGTEDSQNILESSDFSVHRPSTHLEESNGGSDLEEKSSLSSGGDQLERVIDTAREVTIESQNLLESSDFSVHRPSMHLEVSNGGSDFEENEGDNNGKRFSEEAEGHPKRRKSNYQRSENLIVERDNGTSSNMKMNQINGQFQSMSVEATVNDQSFIGSENASVFGIRKSSCIESYNLDPDSTFEVCPDGSLSGKFSIRNQDMDPYLICYDCERL
ncbi:uncharacterized protein TNCV_2855201, partial [Trichonephila clavipes]